MRPNTYIVSVLQGLNAERIAGLFDATGFRDAIRADPFSWAEWLAAAALAPSVNDGFYTVLTARDARPEIERIIDTDPRLAGCFS